MILKWIFDRVVALLGLLVLWPVLVVVAIMVKVKMPGGPAFFVQKRVGKDGKLFNCHKFRTMTVKHNGSTVSVAGDSRITPFGAVLRHYKLDELPGLWDVLVGNMSFVALARTFLVMLTNSSVMTGMCRSFVQALQVRRH